MSEIKKMNFTYEDIKGLDEGIAKAIEDETYIFMYRGAEFFVPYAQFLSQYLKTISRENRDGN